MAGAGQAGGPAAGGRRDRVAAVFFGMVALWLADAYAQALVDRMHSYWNWDGQRLAPVFAVSRGYSLYPRAGEGPPVGYTYGPLSVLAYLPVVVAPDPTTALLGAGVLSMAYTFGPVLALLIVATPRGPGRRGAVALGFLLFAIMARNPSLAYSTMSPAHDAVALGLGLLSCLPLLSREEIGRWPLALSAGLAVLAVSAKQNAVTFLPSLSLYCLIAFGARRALVHAAWLVGLGLALSMVLARIYGGETLAYYLFRIQAGLSMPYDHSRTIEMARHFAAESILPLVLIGVALSIGPATGVEGNPPATLRRRLARNPWALPCLVALGDAPLALMGAVKTGGDVNSMSYTTYFLASAATLLVARAGARQDGSYPEAGRRAVRAIAALACSLWIMNQAIAAPAPIALDRARVARRLRENPNQVAFDYSKQHPGSAYFPWNSLAVLMAEGRLFATEDAIRNVPPPGAGPSYLAAGSDLPGDPEYVAFPPQYQAGWGKYAALGHYPRHRKPVEVPGLERFTIFGRGQAAARLP